MSPVHEPHPPANIASEHANPGWSSHLRSNIAFALDAVKQAAGERNLTMHPWGVGSTHRQEDDFKDRYTPMALRPGRKSMTNFPARITSKEGRELGFRADADKNKGKGPSIEDHEEEDLESLRLGNRLGLRSLGAFSFEGRSIKSWGLRPKAEAPAETVEKNSVAHSTSLKSRPSEICSKPFSSSPSGSSSSSGQGHTDGVMRKRKSKEPRTARGGH
ncbi:hypothetical protein CPB86DRAFT_182037 [Serendipita vermifera]|nr:hypothetical protein CPB86DRAFT_182037 [Serendipita vermifera]